MFNQLLSPSEHRLRLSGFVLMAMVLILTQQSNYFPSRATYWGSYQYRVAYAGGGNITGPTSYLMFTVPFTYAVTNILDMSVVLSSYQLAAYPNMLFRVTQPTYNVALQSASFGVQVVSPSSFSFFRFFVVYNTQQSSSFFEINVKNATCTVASGTIGTTKTEVLTSSMRLAQTGSDTFSVTPVLSSILLYNGAQKMYFTLSSNSTLIINSTLSINLITTSSIAEIIVTTFILKKNVAPAEYVFFIDSSIAPTRTSNFTATCGANFNIPSKFGPLSYNQNCSIGIRYLQDDNIPGIWRNINFDATIAGNPAFSSCVNSAETAASGTMNIGFSIFCSYMAVCTNGTEFYNATLGSTSDNCSSCSLLTTNCLTCNMTTCFTCITGKYPLFNGSNYCLPCNQTNCTTCLSVNTCGACTNSSYISSQTCVSCTQLSHCVLCSSSSYCLVCTTGYGPDPTGTCYTCTAMIPQCTSCQNYYTCSQCNSNYYVSPGASSCISCSFNISNCNGCINSYNCTSCSTGYYLQSSTSCMSCTISVPNCGSCTGSGSCNRCVIGYYLANSASCQACTIPGCYNCTSSTICSTCNLGYYLNASFACPPCNDSHCINCTSATLCVQCDSDYNLNSDNMTCSCKVGSPITDVCSNVTACVTAVKISGVSTCIFCNNLKNFILSGTTCVCKTGYKQSGDQCFTVCGDGITISPEQCDDGNNDNGDGCSSTCTHELGYQCGYNNSIYKCVYTSTFAINLEYILKAETENSATYFFSIAPYTPNLKLNNYTLSYLGVNSLNYVVRSMGYSEGLISVTVDFTKDIEGLNSTFYLNFDPTYFNTTNIAYSFASVGTNQPLIVSNYVFHLKYLKIFAYVILGIGAVILLLSSAYEKMIGIETINVIQIIVFSKLLYVQSDILISGEIISMKYIQGYNDFGKDMSHTNQVPLTYRRLQFNSDYILNFQTGLILMVLSLLILLIMEIYKWRTLRQLMKTKKGSIDEFKLAEQRIEEKKRFIYERIILVVASITLFDCIAAIRLQSRSLTGESHYTYFFINLVALLFSMIYIFSVLTYEVLNVGKEHTWIAYFCSYSQYYVGYYLCYILIVTPILVGGQFFSGILGISIVVGMVVINFITIILWRPYKQAFHNFAIIYNNTVLIFVLLISIIMIFMKISENTELIWAYVVMSLIFLMECFASVRLYMAAMKAPKENQRMNRDGDDEIKKGMEIMEKQYLNPHKRHRNPISKVQQEEDELAKLRNRLKKEFKAKNMEQGQDI